MNKSTRDAIETVEFLVSSPVRPRILEELAGGPVERSDLRERLEVPRSTLHRNLSALLEHGFVSRSPSANEYELTITGAVVHEAVFETLTTVERAQSLSPFLEYFPHDLPVSVDALVAAEVVASNVDAPFDPVSAVTSLVVDGENVRGFLPVVNPVYVDALGTCIEKEISVDVIAPPAAYERLESAHGDAFDDFLEASSIRLSESTAVPTYAVGFVDETVLVGAFDEHMRTHSILRADPHNPIWDWAADRYAEVEDASRRIETEYR